MILMRNILKDKRHCSSLGFSLEQRIGQLEKIMITHEMIPGRSIAIRDLRGLHDLSSLHTTFAFKGLVCITTFSLVIELKELSKILLREMTFHILIFIHDTR